MGSTAGSTPSGEEHCRTHRASEDESELGQSSGSGSEAEGGAGGAGCSRGAGAGAGGEGRDLADWKRRARKMARPTSLWKWSPMTDAKQRFSRSERTDTVRRRSVRSTPPATRAGTSRDHMVLNADMLLPAPKKWSGQRSPVSIARTRACVRETRAGKYTWITATKCCCSAGWSKSATANTWPGSPLARAGSGARAAWTSS